MLIVLYLLVGLLVTAVLHRTMDIAEDNEIEEPFPSTVLLILAWPFPLFVVSFVQLGKALSAFFKYNAESKPVFRKKLTLDEWSKLEIEEAKALLKEWEHDHDQAVPVQEEQQAAGTRHLQREGDPVQVSHIQEGSVGTAS